MRSSGMVVEAVDVVEADQRWELKYKAKGPALGRTISF